MDVSSSSEYRQWKRRPVFAKVYPKMAASGDSIGFAEIREWAMSRARGTGIEIGCGDGRNIEYLPSDVSLTAIEPDPDLAAAARARIGDQNVIVFEGVGERLEASSLSVDFVVSMLTLCTVGDLTATLREARRVLKPGGELIVVEHTLSSSRAFATWQRSADILWPHLSGGCRTARDILGAIESTGFEKIEYLPFDFPSRRSLTPARPMFKGVFAKA